jgi:hypothetical protein
LEVINNTEKVELEEDHESDIGNIMFRRADSEIYQEKDRLLAELITVSVV